ncbi:Hypothetical predicted protein [Cloeon dipterum]|uniref:Uncharacterized protein n=1 Tax=Cloeon dipterum TaxID=197152 RepID=A0A8S1DX55_9INSE|nr:Hypothetical predicted protein [Cloeon dipterum]
MAEKYGTSSTSLQVTSANCLLEALELDRIIARLRPCSFERPLNVSSLAGLSRSKRENLIRRLARVKCNVEPENKIPRSRLIEAMTALVQQPIDRIDFMTPTAGVTDPTFQAFIEKAAASSSHCLKTLNFNLIDTNFWFSRVRACRRFANLQELRVPSFLFKREDFDIVTTEFANLVVLQCNLHDTLTPGSVERMLRRLENIRNFTFDVVKEGEYFWIPNSRGDDERCFPYSRLLAQNLPFLSIIGCDLTTSAQPQRVYPERETRMCHVLDEQIAESLKGASGLKHVVVQRRMHPRQAEWHSESAESLCVVGLLSEDEWKPLSRLRKIKFLYTIDCCPAGKMATRVLATLQHCEHIQKYFIGEDASPDIRLFMTVNPLPDVLDGILELHFFDLPENLNRIVEVMTAPNLERIHITFKNLQESSLKCLKDATRALQLRHDVAPRLKIFLGQIIGKFEPDDEDVLAEFFGVVCNKGRSLKRFQIFNSNSPTPVSPTDQRLSPRQF